MVKKRLCDVCGADVHSDKRKIVLNPDIFMCPAPASFQNGHTEYDLCNCCGNAAERFIRELKERHILLKKFRNNPASVKDQKELSDFE